MSETFIFTPVIRGAHNSANLEAGTLQCSVHVGVRLTPPGPEATVSSFPTFSHWTEFVAGLKFQIVLESGSTTSTLTAATLSTPPSPLVWDIFFPASMPVRTYPATQPLPADYLWFDAQALATKLQAHYASAAQAAIQKVSEPSPQPVPIRVQPGFPLAAREAFTEIGHPLAIGSSLRPEPIRIEPQNPIKPDPLLLSKPYFTSPAPPAVPAQMPAPQPTDAHDLIGYLHETPAVLRMLNLILELEVPGVPLPTQPATIKLIPTFPNGFTPAFLAPAVSFSPADLEQNSGYEPPSGLQVIPYDPMHAAHVYSLYSEGPLPALRSSGMSVMRVPAAGASGSIAYINARQATWLQYENAAANPAAAASLLPVKIADLVRGHRMDVWDGTAWRSLCQVQGNAIPIDAPQQMLIPIDSEGILSSSVSFDLPNGALRANDTLAYWNGWSLCAQRPGAPVNTSAAPASSGNTYLGMQVTRSVYPGSLPRLRFGKQYAFRARLVDIAGNSLPAPSNPAASKGMEQATPLQAFLRLEPVGSPALVFSSPPGPGESSTQIVVCTAAPAPATASNARPEFALRYLLPPETSVEMAEKHGVFDTPAGQPDPNAYQNILQKKLQTTSSLWNAAQPMPATSFPLKADVFQAQTFSVPPTSVPYLPDPACSGAAVIAIQNGPAIGLEDGASLAVSFLSNPSGAAYPDNYQVRSLHLVQGSPGTAGSTTASPDGSGIVIVIPPGERVTLGLASTVAPSAVNTLCLPTWINQNNGSMPTNYFESVQAGLVPSITPNRQLTLIHAVQQPLSAPVLSEVALLAQVTGDLAETITGNVSCDAKTTASLTVEAAWTDWIDGGPGSAAPGAQSITAHIATLSGSALSSAAPAFSSHYVFGDTRYRSMALNGIAASSFVEFFPQGADCTLASAAPVNLVRLSTQQPAAPRLAYAIPTFKWTRSTPSPTAGYTSTRQGNALRIYLERPWFTSGVGEFLAVIVAAQNSVAPAKVSVWGADPLAASQPPSAPNVCDFLSTSEVNLQPRAAYTMPDSSSVTLVPFLVEYDAVTDRYFCDVAFNPDAFAGAYKPFVQLEIAAYQPNALPGLQLSSSITVPFTQILPDRTLTVTLTPGQGAGNGPIVGAVLRGIGPAPATPGTYTSDIGRGIATQVDLHLWFTGIVNNPPALVVPPNPPPSHSNPPPGVPSTGAKTFFGETIGPDGKPQFNPPPPGNLTGKFESLPPSFGALIQQQSISPETAVATAPLPPGHEWEQVQITVYEWELHSPQQLGLVPAGTETVSAIVDGAPDSSTYPDYVFSHLMPRPSHMVYAESVTLSSGFVSNPEPGQILPFHVR
jgi:hypothetical protein